MRLAQSGVCTTVSHRTHELIIIRGGSEMAYK